MQQSGATSFTMDIADSAEFAHAPHGNAARQSLIHRIILAGLLLTAASAYEFSEDIEQLMPLPGGVKKSTPEERAKRRAVKAEDRERQEAIRNMFR